MMVKVAVISSLLIGVAVMLLGVKALFVKNGRFPTGHTHNNRALKEKGFRCHNDL